MVRKKKEALPETNAETTVVENVETTPSATEAPKKVRKPRAPRKKKEAPQAEESNQTIVEVPVEAKSEESQSVNLPISDEPKQEQPKVEEVKVEEPKAEKKPAPNTQRPTPVIPPCPTLLIRNIVELINAPQRQLLLNDQQIQQLTLEDAQRRFRWIEGTLALILNYDIVLSDTNIWLELLTGHTSSHSDPRYNCRLQFERQLEFISRLTQYRGGRFMMMSETYEEIDRFATQMDPVSHKEADFSDEDVCRNIAGRLAKKLILSQQRENRLRIEGIGAESHHGSFADPAIIRRCVELFANGKKVLLLTNDASVAIRSMGMCDDLQRTNNIDDELWDNVYAPLRPMVMTFDDLKVLDAYTRQYHFLQMAAGKQWMEDVPQRMEMHNVEPLELWLEGFRPGDRYSEKKQQQMQQKQNNNGNQQKQNNNQQKQQKAQPKQEPKPQPQAKKEQPKQESMPVVETKPAEKPKPTSPVSSSTSAAEPAQKPVEQPAMEEPKPSLISPEEAAINEEEKKQEQKPKRRGGHRGGRKPKAKTATEPQSENNTPAAPAE